VTKVTGIDQMQPQMVQNLNLQSHFEHLSHNGKLDIVHQNGRFQSEKCLSPLVRNQWKTTIATCFEQTVESEVDITNPAMCPAKQENI